MGMLMPQITKKTTKFCKRCKTDKPFKEFRLTVSSNAERIVTCNACMVTVDKRAKKSGISKSKGI